MSEKTLYRIDAATETRHAHGRRAKKRAQARAAKMERRELSK